LKTPARRKLPQALPLGQLRVVLVAPRNPLNIGAAARAMSNFGFTGLRVVNAYEVAYREARSAVNAAAVLESSTQHQTVADAVADCPLVVGTTSLGPRALSHPLRRLEYGGRLIRKHMESGAAVALLFGSEKFGLSNDDLSHCDWLIRIPTRDEHGSMNLGQAVSICLYELIRSPAAVRATPGARKLADAEQTELLVTLLTDVLDRSGYLNPKTRGSSIAKIRRMVRRLRLESQDAYVWLGMMRQILWRLGAGSAP
jgi:TrmH family RNA methyltransferase